MTKQVREIGVLLGRASWLLLLGYACVVPLALALNSFSAPVVRLSAAVGFALAMLLIARALPAPSPSLGPTRVRALLIAMIVVGVALRVGWVILITPVQLSDFHHYVDHARELLLGHGYYRMLADHRLLAYQAPGEPFLMTAAFALLGDRVWTPAAINVILYVLSSILLFACVSALSSPARALTAVGFFAIWPCGIMITGLAASEIPSLTLWLALALLAIRGATTGHVWPWAVVAGAALGAGILVRPSTLLTSVVLALAAPLAPRPSRVLLQVAVTTLVAALVIAPWTYRNYLVLHAFVPVSTNGGDVFYRANNPRASGTYTATEENSLVELMSDEVAWDTASMQAGEKWVLDNPGAFVKLAARKVLIDLGSDDTGAYWTLARGHGVDGAAYQAAVLASNGWWLVLWGLVAGALVTNRRFFTETAAGLVLTAFSGYFLVIHTVYESQPRYHIPAVGVLLAVAALWSSGAHRPILHRSAAE